MLGSFQKEHPKQPLFRHLSMSPLGIPCVSCGAYHLGENRALLCVVHGIKDVLSMSISGERLNNKKEQDRWNTIPGYPTPNKTAFMATMQVMQLEKHFFSSQSPREFLGGSNLLCLWFRDQILGGISQHLLGPQLPYAH